MSNSNNKKFIIALVGMVLLAGVILVALLRDRFIDQQFRSVTVVGQGRIVYNPDIAIVTIGVQVDKAPTSEIALNQLNSKVSGIVNAVKSLGIGDDNIQVQNYTLSPQYDYKDSVYDISGYNANQQLVIKVHDYYKNPNRLNLVISEGSKAGANQISNLSFDAVDMNNIKQEARIKAINDAKQKSDALANVAGVSLGKIIGWTENIVSPTPNPMPISTGGNGSTAVSVTPAGDREVVIEVGVTYNIK